MRLCLIGRTNLRNCGCVVGCVFVAAFCVVFVLVWIAGRALWQRLTFAAGATFLPPRPVLQGQRPAGPSAHNCCTYFHNCCTKLHKCFTTHELHTIIVALTHSCTGALPLMIITLSLSAQRSSQIIPSSETLKTQVKFCPALALWPFTLQTLWLIIFAKVRAQVVKKEWDCGPDLWEAMHDSRRGLAEFPRRRRSGTVINTGWPGGGRVGSWPTRLSSISISREQGHQQNCVQRRSEEAEKGQDGNELTIGLSTKSDHVSREQCHFDHQPVLPTEMRANQETKRCQPHNWWHFLN